MTFQARSRSTNEVSTPFRLSNPNNADDVFSVLGRAVFGQSAVGSFAVHLLMLMVLSAAAASTLTTILPTARTTLSMAVHKAIPSKFARVSERFMTPTWSTVGMGIASIVFYIGLTWLSSNVLADSIASIGLLIAFYYGMTGFTTPVFYRHTLTSSVRNFVMRGVIPFLGGLILLAAFLQAAHDYWLVGPDADSTRPGGCRSRRTGRSAASSSPASGPWSWASS